MQKRGRKSGAELRVLTPPDERRLKAPDELTDGEKVLWNDIVSSKAASFFDAGTAPLLVELCRLKTEIDRVSVQIDAFEDEWFATDEGVRRFEKLTNIRDKAQGRINALARALRLTNQSRYHPEKAHTEATGKAKSSKRLWSKE